MNTFFQRGGAWVLAQSFLLGLEAWLTLQFAATDWPLGVRLIGIALMLAGLGIGIAGAFAFGRELTPFPKPSAPLVRHGIYRIIRHPIYTGVMALALGWALERQSWPGLVVALLLVPFFYVKARVEESYLRQAFADYASYEREVPRFLPRLLLPRRRGGD